MAVSLAENGTRRYGRLEPVIVSWHSSVLADWLRLVSLDRAGSELGLGLGAWLAI
jgi:hypothetical protein